MFPGPSSSCVTIHGGPSSRERVHSVKPFSTTGVDFAGPFSVTAYRARGAKAVKAYICLFVCFAVKAVHLELTFSLSTDAFWLHYDASFRDVVIVRCCLATVALILLGLIESSPSTWHSETEKIEWSFNPPSAPHFGGLWEAGVKACKTHLARVVGDHILSVEKFSTVLVQVEAILNSRPLCPLSSDPHDLEVLSPGHFLTTEALVSLPSPDLTSSRMNRLDR